MRALRADGYDIDAVTNRGYCLRARPDTLTAGDVLSYLPEARRATVRCFAQIDSTNSYLKALRFCKLDIHSSYGVDNGLYRIKAYFYIAVKLDIKVLCNGLIKKCRTILSIAEA